MIKVAAEVAAEEEEEDNGRVGRWGSGAWVIGEE